MNYNDYLNEELIETIKGQIEEFKQNSFGLVVVNESMAEFNLRFDQLETNHSFGTMPWSEIEGNSIHFLFGKNLNMTEENLRDILKEVYIDSCEIPLNAVL
jgi:hypothetical protein